MFYFFDLNIKKINKRNILYVKNNQFFIKHLNKYIPKHFKF